LSRPANLSGESELEASEAVGAGVSQNTDPWLKRRRKIKTQAIAGNFGLIDFKLIGCKYVAAGASFFEM